MFTARTKSDELYALEIVKAIQNLVVHANEVQRKMNSRLKPQIQKRSLTDIFSVGTFISSIYNTYEESQLDRKIQDLNERHASVRQTAEEALNIANATILLQLAQQEVLRSTAEFSKLNAAHIHLMSMNSPELALITALFTSKMQLFNQYLRQINLNYRPKHIDINALSLLINSDWLMNVISQTTIPVSVESRSQGHVRFMFIARRRSASTEVFQVRAMSIWSNLTTKPTRMIYKEPAFVIYNSTNKCVKRISAPAQATITERCQDPGYEDYRLSRWQADLTVDSLNQIEAVTEVIEGWPNVIVYCFSNNITIDSFTRRCPPDAFEIDASVSFNTTDFKYEGMKSEETSGHLLKVKANFHHVHFKDQTQIVDKNEALDAVNFLSEAVRKVRKNGVQFFKWQSRLNLGRPS